MNNKAEREVANYTLKITITLGAKHIQLLIDMKLLASQFEGSHEARCVMKISYLDIVRELAGHFDLISITQTSRAKNMHTYALAYRTMILIVKELRQLLINY